MEHNLNKICFKEEKGLLGFSIRNSIDTELYLKVLDFIEKHIMPKSLSAKILVKLALKLKL